MLKTISRNILKLATRTRRHYSTCWYPEEPFDEFTRCTYLPNGVRIVTEENCSPLTCISLFVVAGSRYETAYNNGITHFIEHMAYKGFKSVSRSLLETTVHNAGARLKVKTRREMQIFSVVLPSCLYNLGVEYLYKVIADLDLNTCAMDLEKYNMCLEMLDSDVNPRAVVFDYLHSAAFQGTPLGQPVIGPTRNLIKFDTTMMCAYLGANYTTCKLLLCTSGGVCHDNLVTDIGKTFGSLMATGSHEADAGPYRYTGSQVMYRNDDMPFAHVAIAFEAPGYNHPDYYTMLVMKSLLGSWDQSMGRPINQAFNVARWASEGNTCQSYKSFYIVYKDVGLWGAYFIADKHDIDDMVIFLQSAMMSMTIACHSNEVYKAVQMTKLKVSRRYDGVINSSRDIGIQMMYACTRRPLSMIIHHLDAVNGQAIRQAGKTYIYNKSPVVVAVGPTENLSDYSRIESGTYWLRW